MTSFKQTNLKVIIVIAISLSAYFVIQFADDMKQHNIQEQDKVRIAKTYVTSEKELLELDTAYKLAEVKRDFYIQIQKFGTMIFAVMEIIVLGLLMLWLFTNNSFTGGILRGNDNKFDAKEAKAAIPMLIAALLCSTTVVLTFSQ